MTDSTIPQSNSQIKREARIKNQGQRNFGGKLDNFEDNRDRHFNQRMLKAYLLGKSQFPFGFKMAKNAFGILERVKDFHEVILTDKTVEANKLDALLAKGYNDPGKVFGGSSNNKSGIRKIIKERLKKNK